MKYFRKLFKTKLIDLGGNADQRGVRHRVPTLHILRTPLVHGHGQLLHKLKNLTQHVIHVQRLEQLIGWKIRYFLMKRNLETIFAHPSFHVDIVALDVPAQVDVGDFRPLEAERLKERSGKNRNLI